MRTKNLTQEEAESAAKSAAMFTRRAHCAVQLRNGRWTWLRVGFLIQVIMNFGVERYLKIHYFSSKGKLFVQPESGGQFNA